MNLGLLNNSFEEIITPQKSFSYAVEFDGVNDIILAGDGANRQQNYLTPFFEAGDWTIEQWIKDFGNNLPTVSSFLCWTTYLRVSIYQNIYFHNAHRKTDGFWEDWYVPIPQATNKSQWNHLVIRYIAATKTREMFLNNVLIASITSTKMPAQANSLLVLGSGPFITNLYRGKLDDFRIYTRPISNEEISYSYNLGSGNLPMNTTNLLYWFGFERGLENWGTAPCVPRMFNFIDNPFIPR